MASTDSVVALVISVILIFVRCTSHTGLNAKHKSALDV